MKILSCIIWLFSAVCCLAQREAENWYFGTAGLSFKNGEPVLLENSKMNSFEAAAVISDANGNLLFYTDGSRVWDSTHAPMKNGTGLKGAPSSTQGALILPAPGKNGIYYIFTPGGQTNLPLPACPNCAYYSIVDMSGNDGRGEITEKNILLNDAPGVSEKMTAALDCAGTGYWVIFHHESKNIFYSYHLTENGLSNSVMSSAGINVAASNPNAYIYGQMKVSPDGKKLAQANYGLELFDFNTTTGEVSGGILLSAQSDYSSFYSVEFSPDNTKLYADAGRQTSQQGDILQFSIDPPTKENIIASREAIGQIKPSKCLQLAPNGKIYVAWNMDDHLGAINFPNEKGAASDFQIDVLSLKNRLASNFPNFPDFYFLKGPREELCAKPKSNFTADGLAQTYQICKESSVQFRDSSGNAPTRWKWTFEGGLPAEFEGENPPPVYFKESGTYRVTLIATNDFGSDTAFKSIIVRPPPRANAGRDVSVCSGGAVMVGGEATAGYTYKWTPTYGIDDAFKAQPLVKIVFGTKETYFLKVTDELGCVGYDTVVVSPGEIEAILNIPDTTICNGSSVVLKASGAAEYEWNPPAGLSATQGETVIAAPTETTTYRLIASSGDCHDTSFITIAVAEMPDFSAEDLTLCLGETGMPDVRGSADITSWKWTPADGLSDAEIPNPVITALKDQQYSLTAANAAGCSVTKQIYVTVPNADKTTFALTADVTEIEPGGTMLLKTQIAAANGAFTSFKARIYYDPRIFQIEPKSAIFLNGSDNTWTVRCAIITPGELMLEADGTTPLHTGEIALTLNAFLARQTDDPVRIEVLELNGKAITQSAECSRAETRNAKILLKAVCAGDMRLVNVDKFQTFLKTVAPNPVKGEMVEIEFEIGIEGNISLKIYNTQGELVKTVFKGFTKAGVFKENISTSELSAGVYLLKLTTAQEVLSGKLTIVK